MDQSMVEAMAQEVDALATPATNYNYARKQLSPRHSYSDDVFEGPAAAEDGSDVFSFSFSEDDLIPFDTYGPNSDFNEFASRNYLPGYEDSDVLYTKSLDDSTDARITVQRTFWIADSPPETSKSSPNLDNAGNEERKSRRSSRSFSALRLRSKSARRGTDSPAKAPSNDVALQRTDEVVSRPSRTKSDSSRREKSNSRRSNAHQDLEDEVPAGKGFLSRRGSKRAKKPQPVVNPAPPAAIPKTTQSPSSSSSLGNQNATTTQPTPSAMKSKSNVNNDSSSSSKSKHRSNLISPIHGTVLNRVQGKASSPAPKKKDELWNAFRSLDSDYSKFEQKPLNLKANIVRTSLFTFLQNYASHSSNSNIDPQDLERRVKVLDKWWKALLNILDGQSGGTVSGFDRLSIMDAISGLMDRPEWRQAPLEPPTIASSGDSASSSSRPSTSHHSENPRLYAEAVHTTVQHTFMQNLFRQMSLVVDKMAARSVASSLVSFCGKSCAYAFFFCPGMSEVLVRLWHIPARNVRRAADSMGIPRTSNSPETLAKILNLFPECMHCLEFSSYRSAVLRLRSKPVLPMGFEKIPWTGPWLERWCGNESDLLYVFVKYYHCLMTEFLPENPSREELACVPGYILIRAQLLANLDSTIHRFDKTSLEIPADGILDDMVNADGLGIPPLPSNASRLITENRLVMLMRTFLSQTSPAVLTAQTLFANCVCDLMKVAACTTSLFDQGSCFTICDLLQELVVILGKFEERTKIITDLDWDFWLLCFTQMIHSDSTLTLIRIIALIFTSWPFIAANENRKSSICFNFLLQEDVFSLYFLHWCPMIRSYFMRLLAWRLARFDGDATLIDSEIYKWSLDRILEIWSYFKDTVEGAEEHGYMMPSTAPCNPAPGRRLLIIRTDNILPSNINSTISSSESSSPTDTPKTETSGSRNGSTNSGGSFSPTILFEKLSATLEQGIDSGKRKSGLFRSFSSPRLTEQRAPSEDWSGYATGEASLGEAHSAPISATPSRTSLYEQRPWIPTDSKSRPKTANTDKATLHEKEPQTPRQAEFRFSIEPGDRRPNKLPANMSLGSPKLPHAAYMHLQSLPDFIGDVQPSKPDNPFAINGLRYSGRALAEWSLVVNECQNFFERRRKEGVPTSKQVETPIMSSEPFRRFG